MNTFVSDWYYLSIRSIKQIWRPMLALLPSLFIPIFFFFVNSQSLTAFSHVPGFPNVSYKNFIAPVAIFTAIFFSSGNAGIELVQDISNGYFKKLLIMPISRLAILFGRFSEVAVQAVFQGGIVIVLLYVAGVRFNTGILGILAAFGILILFAMGWSCISMISALRTQNARLVQSLFVVVFPFLYITTSQAPMELLPSGFRAVAKFNPVTYVIEGVRALVLYDWGRREIFEGFLVSLAFFLIMSIITLYSFQKTLK